MIGAPLVIVFRLIHVVVGVFWVGALLFFARFIFPSAIALGGAAFPFMDQLGRVRKVPLVLMGSGLITVISGFILYWNDAAGMPGVWAASTTGKVIGGGALLAVIALTIGLTVNKPAFKKLLALGAAVQSQGGKPSAEQSAEIQRLQGRLAMALRIISVLLLLATASMAVARYVP